MEDGGLVRTGKAGYMTDKLMTDIEVAEYLHYSTRTVRNWRYTDKGPKWIRVGGGIRYRPEDVETWLEANPRGVK